MFLTKLPTSSIFFYSCAVFSVTYTLPLVPGDPPPPPKKMVAPCFSSRFYKKGPKGMIGWLAVLLYILMFLSSNLVLAGE
jgi:hypothetical protein